MAGVGTEQGSSGAEWEVGGMRLSVSFRAPDGATLRIFGPVGDTWKEILRFDDFVDAPHYHVPAHATPVPFDRANGEPLAWFVTQVQDHLAELIAEAGYGELLERVDAEAVAAEAPKVEAAMEACVPAGYARVPGVGLTRLAPRTS